MSDWKKGCCYRCCNSPHGIQLFRFPQEEKRQDIWVENSGSVWIKGRSRKSLPSYGLCEKHSDCNDLIQNAAGKERLRPGANPKHWGSEDQQQLIRDAQKNEGDGLTGNVTRIQRQVLETILEQPEEEASSLDLSTVVNNQDDTTVLTVHKSDAVRTYSSGKDLLRVTEEQDSDVSYMNFVPQPPVSGNEDSSEIVEAADATKV
ncbi:hypothetical protein QAD02_006496 [Eretmocerus hayati]|uniref:Uncharacterized protein n=1 Tax=Eretmocerus hayati TaxID=131215 RepID=A0ACC2N3E1_9HYME|nr:hypothetical protein QAD02_006496 [Eretmocerus hayati]